MGAQFVGGPNNVEPGESVTAIVHFDEGAHGVACFIPDDKDGKPHAEHGMVGRVNVVKTADSVVHGFGHRGDQERGYADPRVDHHEGSRG